MRKHPIEVAISPPIEMAISPPDDVALRVKKVELRGRGRDDMSGQRGLVFADLQESKSLYRERFLPIEGVGERKR